jgi:hypothetical protein
MSCGNIKTWTQVFEVLEHEIINCPDDDSFTAKIRHLAQSKMHKINARPIIIPYNDMINWLLEHVDIQTRSIINHQQVIGGSFQPNHLQLMYNLTPTPKYTYNAAFLLYFERKECTRYARNDHDIVKT